MQDVIKKGGGVQVKVGTHTRDTALASGNEAITGIGFKPKAIIVSAVQSTTKEASWHGVDDGVTAKCIVDDSPAAVDTYKQADWSIWCQESGADYYVGKITSWDNDGFTIQWVKGANPTGTITVNYLVIG